MVFVYLFGCVYGGTRACVVRCQCEKGEGLRVSVRVGVCVCVRVCVRVCEKGSICKYVCVHSACVCACGGRGGMCV